ncbi:MAG: Ig-like domain-containing protein [Pseudomonadota bacterium]
MGQLFRIFVFLLFILFMSFGQAEDLKVLTAIPNTENVPDVQQITITFNRPMVPLGDFEKMAQNLGVKVEPKIDCHWRWLNTSTLACQLNDPLPLSNEYQVTVPSGFKASDGSTLKDNFTAKFSTIRWEVVNKDLEWAGPDRPEIYLTFNQPMDLKSLQSQSKSKCGTVKVQNISKEKAIDMVADSNRTYLFNFKAALGLARACTITIDANAQSATGKLASKKFEYDFTTYPEFKIADVTCYEKKTGSEINKNTIQIKDCDPDSGVYINFTSPTTGGNLSGRIKTEPQFGWPPGGEGSPEYYQQYAEQTYNGIYLRSPLQGKSKHLVTFDNGLKDQWGRSLNGPKQVEILTTDFNPILGLPSGYGVMEKDGPHQLAFTGVNINSIDLNYFSSNKLEDAKMWGSYHECTNKYNKKKF